MWRKLNKSFGGWMKLEGIYKKLSKIADPVLIDVERGDYSRMRILYPSGRCEWSSLKGLFHEFNRSCFVPLNESLEGTLRQMQIYDQKHGLEILRYQEI
jgi:hypothetical protein